MAGSKKKKLTSALKERTKELNCLYEYTRIVSDSELSLDQVLQQTAELIPPAWQFPEITCARIIYRDIEYTTSNFRETHWCIFSELYHKDDVIGQIKVCYTEKKPERDEGPFLKEERNLLDTLAAQLSAYIVNHTVQKTAENISDILENLVNEVFIFDYNSLKYIYANKKALENIGYSLEELKQMSPVDIKPEFSSEEFSNRLKPLKEGAISRFETIHKRKDGSIYNTEINFQLSNYGGRKVYVAVVSDITAHKESERQFAEIEKRYKMLFDTMSQGVIYYDEKGKIIESNYAAKKIFGLTSEQVAKRKNEKIANMPIYENGKVLEKEEFPSEVALRTGRKIEGAIIGIWNDALNEYVWVRVNSVPLFENGKDKITGVYTILEDITELKRTSDLYKGLFTKSPIGIFRTSSIGKPLAVNPALAEMLGFESPEEALNYYTDIGEELYVNPHRREEFIKLLRIQGEVTNFEYSAFTKDNDIIWLNMSARISREVDNREFTIDGFTEDISVRKKYESELIKAKEKAEAADKLKSNLLANLSHEFRTPLTGIMGLSDFLASRIEDGSYHKMLSDINFSGKRLLSTLNAILDYAQLETYEETSKSEKVDIHKLCRQVTDQYLGTARKKDIDLILEIESSDLTINSSEYLVRIILEHLIDNAVKFTKEGSVTVELFTRQNGRYKTPAVRIKDTGIGFHQNQKEIIFEEFRQISEGIGRSFEGTGLGLAIVAKASSIINADINVKSEPDRGTEFTVLFSQPLTDQKTKEPENGSEKERKKRTAARPEVLIVEDNRVNIDVIELFLEDSFELDYVFTGEEALEKVKSREYDLIIIDINLGSGIDGTVTMSEIRKLDKYKTKPIIAVTGYAMIEEKDKLLDSGFSGYLAKPFESEELINKLKEYVHF